MCQTGNAKNIFCQTILQGKSLCQACFITENFKPNWIFFYQENLCQTGFQSWTRDNIASQKRDNGLEKIRKNI